MTKKILLIGIVLVLLSSLVSATLIDDLDLYYTFDDADLSSGNPIDVHTGAYNGTTQGDPTTGVSGILGETFTFDGTGDYIDLDLGHTDMQPYSMSVWVNVDEQVDTEGHVFSFIDHSGDHSAIYFAILQTTGKPYFRSEDSDGATSYYQHNADWEGDATWHHVVFTLNPNTDSIIAYIDGSAVYTNSSDWGTGDFKWDSSRGPFVGIKQDSGTPQGTREFTGEIDELAVWNRTLTADEVTELWNGGSGLAYSEFIPSNTEFDTPVYEDTITEHSIVFTDYNITADSTATLNYNGTDYEGTINYTDWNLTTFTADVTTPIVYLNNTNVSLYWQYNLTYHNSSTEQNQTDEENQFILWNLTNYPRVNVTAHDLVNDTAIQNFTITGGQNTPTTTDGEVYVRWNSTDQVNLTFSSDGYATMSEMVNFTSGNFTSHQFNIYTTNSINFTIRDEITDELITDDVSIEFISDVVSYNYTATDGSIYVDLLQPTDYTIRYSSDGYGQRHTYLTVTNNTYQEQTLYLLNETADDVTATTFVIYDATTVTKLENAVVTILRYDQLENEYFEIGSYTTDISGSAYFDLQHDTELYKILVEYPLGTLKYTSSAMYITSELNNIYISLYDSPTETFYDSQEITYTLVYENSTTTFDATWLDSDGSASEICLTLYKYGTYGNEQLNESCSTSNSGSLSVGGMDENATYYGKLSATINGGTETLGNVWKTFYSDTLQSGSFGIFMAIVIFTIFAFLSMVHTYSVILGSTTLLFAKMMGLLQIDWITLITITIVSIILVIIMEMKKR